MPLSHQTNRGPDASHRIHMCTHFGDCKREKAKFHRYMQDSYFKTMDLKKHLS